MTLLLRKFLCQRNTDHNKSSSSFYTVVSGGYSFPKSFSANGNVVNAQNSFSA